MRKRYFLLFVFVVILVQTELFGQGLIIRGIVMDENTLKPMSSVSVMLDKKNNAITDTNGFFSFNTVPGKHQGSGAFPHRSKSALRGKR